MENSILSPYIDMLATHAETKNFPRRTDLALLLLSRTSNANSQGRAILRTPTLRSLQRPPEAGNEDHKLKSLAEAVQEFGPDMRDLEWVLNILSDIGAATYQYNLVTDDDDELVSFPEEDNVYIEEQITKSFRAAVTCDEGQDNDGNPNYRNFRGSVCHPETGEGDYDPAHYVIKSYYWSNTLPIIPALIDYDDKDLLEASLSIMSDDMKEKAAQLAVGIAIRKRQQGIGTNTAP